MANPVPGSPPMVLVANEAAALLAHLRQNASFASRPLAVLSAVHSATEAHRCGIQTVLQQGQQEDLSLSLDVSSVSSSSSAFEHVAPGGKHVMLLHALRTQLMAVHSRIQSQAQERGFTQHTANAHAALYLIKRFSEWLQPFLGVVKSEHTSGPITGTALASVHRFVMWFFSLDAGTLVAAARIEDACREATIQEVRASQASALGIVAQSVTRCKFPATDPAQDEVVLMRILHVLAACVSSDSGELLSDRQLFELVQTCFRMATMQHLSELLRSTASSTLLGVIRTSCNRFAANSTRRADSKRSLRRAKNHSDSVDLDASSVVPEALAVASPLPSVPTPVLTDESDDETVVINHRGVRFQASSTQLSSQPPTSPRMTTSRPFGSSFIRQLLTYCCSIIAPKEQSDLTPLMQVDSTLLGLRMCSVMLQSLSSLFCMEQFVDDGSITRIIRDSLCKHVLRAMCTSNTHVLSAGLGICVLLMGSTLARPLLRAQIPVMLRALCALVDDTWPEPGKITVANGAVGTSPALDPRTPPNTPSSAPRNSEPSAPPPFHLPREGGLRENVLGAVVELCRDSEFVRFLYFEYDCVPLRSCFFEAELLTFLQHVATCSTYDFVADAQQYSSGPPAPRALHPLNIIALDGLISVLRASSSSVRAVENIVDLQRIRSRKFMLAPAVADFNAKQFTECFRYLASQGLYSSEESTTDDDPLSPSVVALFLRECEPLDLDPTVVGEFLGKNKEFSKFCLRAYVDTFREAFSKSSRYIDSARLFLESFRVPGEAQIISRVLECFAQVFFECAVAPRKQEADQQHECSMFADADAVEVLTYSVLMLNVDQHSTKVKERMSLEAFIRNVRGINGVEQVWDEEEQKTISRKGDFPREMCESIYQEVHGSEFIIPSEHQKREHPIPSFVWRHAARQSTLALPHFSEICTPAGRPEELPMFRAVWSFAHPALLSCFELSISHQGTTGASLMNLCIAGLEQGAMTAANSLTQLDANSALPDGNADLTAIVDEVVVDFCKLSGLLATQASIASFGRSKRGRRAAIAAFRIAASCGDAMRDDGWKHLIAVLITLNHLSLLDDKAIVERRGLVHALDVVQVRCDELTHQEDIAYQQRQAKKSAVHSQDPKRSSATQTLLSTFGLQSWWSSSPQPSRSERSPSRLHARTRTGQVSSIISESESSDDGFVHGRSSVGSSLSERDAEFSTLLAGSMTPEQLTVSSAQTADSNRRVKVQRGPGAVDPDATSAALDCVKACKLHDIFIRQDVHHLSLRGLVHSLVVASQHPKKALHMREERTALFSLDLLMQVVVLNLDEALSEPVDSGSSQSLWSFVTAHLLDLLTTTELGPEITALRSRAVTHLLAACVTLLEKTMDAAEPAAALHSMALHSLQELLVNVSNDDSASVEHAHHLHTLRERVAPRIAFVCSRLYTRSTHIMRDSDIGRNVFLSFFRIIGAARSSAELGLFLLRRILSCVLDPDSTLEQHDGTEYWMPRRPVSQKLAQENFTVWIRAIMCFCTGRDQELVGSYGRAANRSRLQALELLFELYSKVPNVWIEDQASTDWTRAWDCGWFPILEQLSLLCRDKRHRIRNQATSFLQRTLLCATDTISGAQSTQASRELVIKCLDRVVFPLLDELCGSDPSRRGGVGRGSVEETRVRAFALLSKVFLQYLPLLTDSNLGAGEDFAAIWLHVLATAEKYIHCAAAARSDVLAESVPESLKNMLLVINGPATGFIPGSNLWKESWQVLDRVSPRLRGEFGQLVGATTHDRSVEVQPGVVDDTLSPVSSPAPAHKHNIAPEPTTVPNAPGVVIAIDEAPTDTSIADV